MKVIFLDVDGVLNTPEHFSSQGVVILPEKLALLKQIVEATGAGIVLSTSWREYWEQEETLCRPIGQQINSIFNAVGLRILDKTPQEPPRREAQIESWLNDHPEVEAFVVLDDALLSAPFLQGHFVKTSPYFGALDEMDVQRAIVILNG